ncbi:YciI family protein [Stenotrophomonas sp. RIT309]|uniref:YciI family protein n=1 Tax=Stenotrophomonas sp. RIT309 TaxID=1470590 RepID=UPI0013786F8E|nr:YciI family protein [Stenotrophomonas sp. RIT309]
MLLLTGDGDVPAWEGLNESEQAALMERFEQFQSECDASGVEILAGEALQGGESATTVCRSGGARVVSEGPYAAAYKGLGGFFLVETPNLDLLLKLSDVLPPYDMEFRPVDMMG